MLLELRKAGFSEKFSNGVINIMINSSMIYILLFTNLVCFCLGMLVFSAITKASPNNINEMVSISSKKHQRNKSQIEDKESIEIDDTKYVSKISTDNLEKKYESLGKVKSTQNDTASSVSKLKNLKG